MARSGHSQREITGSVLCRGNVRFTQKRSFVPGQPSVRFAPIAVIRRSEDAGYTSRRANTFLHFESDFALLLYERIMKIDAVERVQICQVAGRDLVSFKPCVAARRSEIGD